MKIHLVGLPHTELSKKYSWCPFTQKTRILANMLTDLGWDVILYGAENNEARCTEYVQVIDRAWQVRYFNQFDWSRDIFNSYDSNLPFWGEFNFRVSSAIRKNCVPGDIIGISCGSSQLQITHELPELYAVEFGVGYPGAFAPYRVYDSYAWQSYLTGKYENDILKSHHEVIPPAIDLEDFPLGIGGEYLLFMGRMIQNKGVEKAVEAANILNMPLVLVGQGLIDTGDFWKGDNFQIAKTKNISYAGVVGPQKRAELLGGARALLSPTIYFEPFGMVATEAMACGTPVISTDWGGFTDTIIHGVTGYRCNTLSQFLLAIEKVANLDRNIIREYVVETFSTEVIKYRFDSYFRRFQSGTIQAGWNDLGLDGAGQK